MAKKKDSQYFVELAFHIVLLAWFGYVSIDSISMSTKTGLVPQVICGIGSLMTIVLLVTMLMGKSKNTDVAAPATAGTDENDTASSVGGNGSGSAVSAVVAESTKKGVGIAISVAFTVGYIVCFYVFGFAMASFAALAFIPIIMGYKKWILCLSYSAALTVLLYFVFVKLFFVRLPAGLVIDLLFS